VELRIRSLSFILSPKTLWMPAACTGTGMPVDDHGAKRCLMFHMGSGCNGYNVAPSCEHIPTVRSHILHCSTLRKYYSHWDRWKWNSNTRSIRVQGAPYIRCWGMPLCTLVLYNIIHLPRLRVPHARKPAERLVQRCAACSRFVRPMSRSKESSRTSQSWPQIGNPAGLADDLP